MTDIIYKDEVYQIVGAAMEVYNEMGHGFLEPVYQESFALELSDKGIPHQEQAPLKIYYKSRQLQKEYIVDYITHDEILVEIKAIEKLTSREESQLINYLKATQKRLGLLINFGNKDKLEWKRIVN